LAANAELIDPDYSRNQRVKRFSYIAWLRVLILLLAIGFAYFCIWNSALLEPQTFQQNYILALIACTFGVIAFVSGRLSFALVLSGTLFFALKFISVMKLRFLNSPLMPADFVYFARDSLLETLKQYPHMLGLLIGVCIVAPLLLWFIWHFDVRFLAMLQSRRLRVGLRLVGGAACALAMWWCMQPNGPFSTVYNTGLWNTFSNNAHLTNFFVALRDMQPALPAMSSDATAAKNWATTAERISEGANASSQHPDIIQVLEESTFDPSNFAGCTIPQCRPKMLQPDQYTRAHGYLRTHTFGGGTWVSEFSVLSGMPQDIFGAAGMYAPFVLAPRLTDSLPLLLKRLGYQTIAVYPVDGGFLNARNAYRAYGFDKFYDAHDLGLRAWHTSDAQMFAAAKKVYDENRKSGQPIFIMILTLEQHGPHDTKPLKDLPAPFNRGMLPGLSSAQELNLSAYLSRLQDSDKGMALLERDFQHRPQPTVIMHFGEHQPSFSGVIRGMARTLPPSLGPYKNNLTYFMLKSNFAGPALPTYPLLDIAYLPNMVRRAAGLPGDSYFSALNSLEIRCRGLYGDCPDKPLLESYYSWIFNRLRVYQ
jgi:phosphoglycerol transferase MdoB-like AlkP superfamily enzyme